MGIDDIPPHLSADEHLLRLREERLIEDGRQWLRRAAELYSHTSKIKIWVPVVGSMLMTGYYLYTIHAHAALPADTAVEATSTAGRAVPSAVAVADDAPAIPKAEIASAPSMDGEGDGDLLRRAQEAHARHQAGEEARLLQKVLDRSGSQQVCPAIGRAYEAAGEVDSAIQSLERCAKMAPQNVETWLALAHALQAKPDFKRSAEIYRLCMQRDAGNLDAQTGLALMELKQNHLSEAGQVAQTVLRRAPENTDALLVTGLVAWRQTRLPDAEKIFSKGVEIDERRADFHTFLGRIAEAQRRPQRALEEYERALTLDPDDSDTAERRDRLRAAR